MTGSFLLYLVIGKLLIWALQKFGRANFKTGFIARLVECQFCLGVWIMTILALLLKMKIMTDVFPYVPILTELIVGVVSSFALHISTLGWHEQFDTVVI